MSLRSRRMPIDLRAALLGLALLPLSAAWAGPGSLIQQAIGRRVLLETPTGRELTRAVLGREARSAGDLERFVAKLGEQPGGAAQLRALETRLGRLQALASDGAASARNLSEAAALEIRFVESAPSRVRFLRPSQRFAQGAAPARGLPRDEYTDGLERAFGRETNREIVFRELGDTVDLVTAARITRETKLWDRLADLFVRAPFEVAGVRVELDAAPRFGAGRRLPRAEGGREYLVIRGLPTDEGGARDVAIDLIHGRAEVYLSDRIEPMRWSAHSLFTDLPEYRSASPLRRLRMDSPLNEPSPRLRLQLAEVAQVAGAPGSVARARAALAAGEAMFAAKLGKHVIVQERGAQRALKLLSEYRRRGARMIGDDDLRLSIRKGLVRAGATEIREPGGLWVLSDQAGGIDSLISIAALERGELKAWFASTNRGGRTLAPDFVHLGHQGRVEAQAGLGLRMTYRLLHNLDAAENTFGLAL